jgi:hypothetical protein
MSRGQHCKYTRTGMGVGAIATGSAFAVVPVMLTGTTAPSAHQDATHAARLTTVPAQRYAAGTDEHTWRLANPGGQLSLPTTIRLASSITEAPAHPVPSEQGADDSSSTSDDQGADDSSSTSDDQGADDSSSTSDDQGADDKTCGDAHSKYSKQLNHGKHHKRGKHQSCAS